MKHRLTAPTLVHGNTAKIANIHPGYIATPVQLTHIANFETNDTFTLRGKLPSDWFAAAPSTTVFTTVSTTPVPLSIVHPAVRIIL